MSCTLHSGHLHWPTTEGCQRGVNTWTETLWGLVLLLRGEVTSITLLVIELAAKSHELLLLHWLWLVGLWIRWYWLSLGSW